MSSTHPAGTDAPARRPLPSHRRAAPRETTAARTHAPVSADSSAVSARNPGQSAPYHTTIPYRADSFAGSAADELTPDLEVTRRLLRLLAVLARVPTGEDPELADDELLDRLSA